MKSAVDAEEIGESLQDSICVKSINFYIKRFQKVTA